MKYESKFLKKYKKEMMDILTCTYPDMEKNELEEIIDEMIKKNLRNPQVILDNNYTGERRDSTLLSIFDWTYDRKPIICGNATFYKNQHESINPIAKMLEGFLTDRKMYKKKMFEIEDTSSARYKDLDRSQLNEKINSNS